MMLRRLLPVAFLALLLIPSAAFAGEGENGAPKEYVTEFFLALIIGIIALFAVIAGFEARRAGRKGSSH
jgi:heme/copper-type cytochrome/quinol oxidase subunit 4